jgi:hypothetical protein
MLFQDVKESEQTIGVTHVKFITKYLTNIPADCVKILALRLTITKVEIMRNIEGGAKQLNVYRKGV